MAVVKLKVSYIDGRNVEVVASPRAQVETERHFKGVDQASKQALESHYYVAWASLHFAGKESADFESFLNTIADVTEVVPTGGDENASDPTPATASTTGSSD